MKNKKINIIGLLALISVSGYALIENENVGGNKKIKEKLYGKKVRNFKR